MIDFNNSGFFKLKKVDNDLGIKLVSDFLILNEEVYFSYSTIRDFVIFTNKRLITVNVQGITGKKKDFTSLPFNRIQAFSVETSGHFDLDSELELWFSGLGKVKLEFTSNCNIKELNTFLSLRIL